MLFHSTHPHYEHLRKKWTAKHREASDSFLEKYSALFRHFTMGSLGGLMLLTTHWGNGLWPQHQVLASLDKSSGEGIVKGEDKNRLLAEKLKGLVPEEVRKLTSDEEDKISQTLSEALSMAVKPEIDGIRLNRSYGLIGGEQHLYRYPGDSLYKHTDSTTDWAMYGPSGIAPGLGAWGYFAPSEKAMTQEDKLKEKYYIAVQTFLVPGYAENASRYRDFFKFRKVLVVNPANGVAVMTVIGDAGPSEWTGKYLGGSPEVMHFLGLGKGPRKGAVLYFFVNDPDNKVPLGPVVVSGRG